MDPSNSVGNAVSHGKFVYHPDLFERVSCYYWLSVKNGFVPTEPGALAALAKEIAGENKPFENEILRRWGIR